jgi:hypothetical protein
MIAVFWEVTLCSVADRYLRFGGTCCVRLYSSALHLGAGYSSKYLPTICRIA